MEDALVCGIPASACAWGGLIWFISAIGTARGLVASFHSVLEVVLPLGVLFQFRIWDAFVLLGFWGFKLFPLLD